MIRDQQQASTSDLSQSAYDSAQAGVEDAKRALLRWQEACNQGSPQCANLTAVMADQRCNTVAQILYGRSPADMNETKVQLSGSSADAALDQAYTCTVIKTDTENYQGKMEADESKLVRLRGVGTYDRIELSWFMERDLASGSRADLDNETTLPSSWNPNRPPLMRTQLIRAGDNFQLEDFNNNNGSSTIYLYPVRSGLSDGFDFVTDARRAPKRIDRVGCQQALGSGLYFCNATVAVPGGVAVNDEAFLRLTSHYNATHFEIKLFNGSEPVFFNGVQPQVDSTGRANDLFRRVNSRVELVDPVFPYPRSAVDTNGNFCKNFLVTDQEIDYSDGGCTP